MAQFTADIAGALNRGLQFRQENELRPAQLALANQNVANAEQGFRAGEQNMQFNRTQDRALNQQIDQRTDDQKNQSLYRAAMNIGNATDEQIIPILEAQIANVEGNFGGDAAESRRVLEIAKAGDFQGARSLAKQAIDIGIAQGDIKSSQGGTSGTKFFAPQTDPDTGQQFVIRANPNTGDAERVNIEGAIQRTSAQSNQSEVNQATAVETAKGKVTRTNQMKKEFGDMRRQAARARIPIMQALKLVSLADQGLAGAAKVQIARIIPGIDVANEAQLDAALSTLALDQLQKFSGPTTDFEYAVTESIAGRLSDPATANDARVKSLDRANWFINRESEQFDKFITDGGDPDTFAFDFNEEVKTKKATLSLQSLQDSAVAANATIEEALKRLNE
jgi:hypothetical protein